MNERPRPQTSALEVPAKQQFGLGTIFFFVAVYAAGLPFGAWTIGLTTLILGGWWIFFNFSDWKQLIALLRWALMFAIGTSLPFLVVAFGTGLLTFSVQEVRGPHRRTQCLNYFREINSAIINYESGRGAFPPAFETDDAGKPIHSWRVLMLPSIGEEALYAKYDFSEPWDGPNNIKLVDQMPWVYACPFESGKGLTPYKLVVDKDTPFEAGKILSYADILDDSSSTFAIVEDLKDPIPWTKPEDLTIEQAVVLLTSHVPELDRLSDHGVFSSRLARPTVSLLDGNMHGFSPSVHSDVIRDFCTRNDLRVVDRDALTGFSITVIHWERYIALIAYIILLAVPGLAAVKRAIANRSK